MAAGDADASIGGNRPGPDMGGDNGIEDLARRVAEEVGKRLGAHDFSSSPQVYPGGHEGSSAPFVVSWEQGPFQWTYQYDVLYSLCEEIGVFLEAVNHFALGVYPIPRVASLNLVGGEQMAKNESRFAVSVRASVEALLGGIADTGEQRRQHLSYAAAFAQQALNVCYDDGEREIGRKLAALVADVT
jgi:hypothetical protein